MSAVLLTNIGYGYIRPDEVNKKISDLISIHPDPDVIIGTLNDAAPGLNIEFIKIESKDIKISISEDKKLAIDGIDRKFDEDVFHVSFNEKGIKFTLGTGSPKPGDTPYVDIYFRK